MSKPTRITPHISGTTRTASTGWSTDVRPLDFGTRPVRSSGRITTASAEAARNDAMRRIQRDRTNRRVFTGA